MEFSVEGLHRVDLGKLVAAFTVLIDGGDIVFDAQLCDGPYGHFVCPVGVRDQRGMWQHRLSLSRAFSTKIRDYVLLVLKERVEPRELPELDG